MLDANGDVVDEGIEHATREARGRSFDRDDRERTGRVQRALDPSRHHEIGEIDEVIAVHVRDEHRVELVRGGPDLGQPQDRSPPRVELERGLTVADENAGPAASRRRMRHAGTGEGDGRRGHRLVPSELAHPTNVST